MRLGSAMLIYVGYVGWPSSPLASKGIARASVQSLVAEPVKCFGQESVSIIVVWHPLRQQCVGLRA